MNSRALVLSMLLPLAACEKTSDPSVIEADAQVSEVEIRILESFPVQVHAVVRGDLPDGCTRIESVEQSREGNEFRIRIRTARPADAFCTEALVPFQEVVPLDVLGLPAGEYRVVANNVAASFRLDVDNR